MAHGHSRNYTTLTDATWMFGTGMRSIKELGFGSNPQALKYGLLMRGVDKRLSSVAVYGLIALVIG
jgi:hypothetical protein